MPIEVPQLFVSQSIPVPAAQIRTLFSDPPTIFPEQSNFIVIFFAANIFYLFDTTPFSDFNNLIYFKVGSTIVSNQLNATNILSLAGASYNFSPANPYNSLMSSSDNLPLKLCMDGADPTGGGDNAQLIVNYTIGIVQKS